MSETSWRFRRSGPYGTLTRVHARFLSRLATRPQAVEPTRICALGSVRGSGAGQLPGQARSDHAALCHPTIGGRPLNAASHPNRDSNALAQLDRRVERDRRPQRRELALRDGSRSIRCCALSPGHVTSPLPPHGGGPRHRRTVARRCSSSPPGSACGPGRVAGVPAGAEGAVATDHLIRWSEATRCGSSCSSTPGRRSAPTRPHTPPAEASRPTSSSPFSTAPPANSTTPTTPPARPPATAVPTTDAQELVLAAADCGLISHDDAELILRTRFDHQQLGQIAHEPERASYTALRMRRLRAEQRLRDHLIDAPIVTFSAVFGPTSIEGHFSRAAHAAVTRSPPLRRAPRRRVSPAL